MTRYFIFSIRLFILMVFFQNLASAPDPFNLNPWCKQSDAIEKTACMTEHAAQGIKLHLNHEAVNKGGLDIFRALEAMNLVQNIAGTARYSWLKTQNYNLPTNDQSKILKNGYGLCGNHQYFFIEIMKLLNVEARPVDFYFTLLGTRQTHTAVEVKIDNKWRYFDITWGSFWLERQNDLSSLISIDEVLKGKGIKNSGTNSWYLFATDFPSVTSDPFAYLKSQDLQILKNKGGVFSISMEKNGVDFKNIPNYIGKVKGNDPLVMTFRGTFPPKNVIINVQGVACTDGLIHVGSSTWPVVPGEIKTKISSKSTLSIQSTNEECYAVFSDIKVA